MPRAHPAQYSFNAGEWSPLLHSRSDLAKYNSATRKMSNMVPAVQGPATRRGGTRMVAAQKDVNERGWSARFVFNKTQGYILEFSPGFIRFYTNRAQLTVSNVAYEVVTPYTAQDLTNADGCFALRFQQSGDVLYIMSANHWPQKLSRLGATNWTLTEYTPRNGPLLDQNSNKTLRLYASARTGSGVVVTASAAVFEAGHVGALLRLDVENLSSVLPWEPGKAIEAAGRRRSDGKTYLAQNADAAIITGSKVSVHEEGTAFDGSGVTNDTIPKVIGISWLFEDAGYGVARITAVNSPTEAVVTVHADSPFPFHVAGDTNLTNAWWLGAWCAAHEFPSDVCIWKNRLCTFTRRRFGMSVPNDFDDMARDIVGQVRTDAGIHRGIESAENDAIVWVMATESLLVGTAGEELVIKKATSTEPLGPNNIDSDPLTAYGSLALPPLRVGDGVLFCHKAGHTIYDAGIDPSSGTLGVRDRTLMCEHLTADTTIVDWAYQHHPYKIIWAALSNGKLIALTLDREQDVIAGHQHPTDGLVESVKVIPSPDGKTDDVWLFTRRNINGIDRRFIEVMDRGDAADDPQAECYFVDCGLTYRGAPATTFSIPHLAGEAIAVLADGAVVSGKVAALDGSFTLSRAASIVHAGLPMAAYLQPMPLDAGGARGTSQGKNKRIDHVGISFYRTGAGVEFGPDDEHMDTIASRLDETPLGTPTPLFTGTVDMEFDGDYEFEGNVIIRMDQPLPMTVRAIMPEVSTHERG